MRKSSMRGIFVLIAALAIAVPVTATASTDRYGVAPTAAPKKPPVKSGKCTSKTRIAAGYVCKGGRVVPKQAKAPSLINAKALTSLVKAARAEGSLTMYSALSDSPNARIAAAFQKKYGITVQVIRAPGTTLLTRLATEETAGQHSADIVMLSDDPCGFVTAHPSWVQSFNVKAVPLWASYRKNAKNYLRKCDNRWTFPVIGIKPWGIIYNSDRVTSPPTWKDLLTMGSRASFSDARVADAYYNFWYLMLQTYGASFLQDAGKSMKVESGGTGAAQNVAAGATYATMPTHIGVYSTVNASGKAPVALTIPSPTVGLETTAFLLASNIVPHPNAAKLFMNYLLSGEGNLRLAGGGGTTSPDGYSIYHLQGLPKNYTAPETEKALAAKAQINSLLGLK